MDHVEAAAQAIERYLAERSQTQGPLSARDSRKLLKDAIEHIVAAARQKEAAGAQLAS